MNAIYAAILSDVISSRREPDFKTVRDTILNRLSAQHSAEGWISVPYAVTAWDEFQVLSHEIGAVPRIFWSLIKGFYPLKLRIGVGIGGAEINGDSGAPLNEIATGEAFFRARKALTLVKKGKHHKGRPSFQVDTGNRAVDLFMNTTFHLLDTLVARTTPSQWEIILAYEELQQQDLVAERLNKADSTVSRSLKRSCYWQMVEAIDAMAEYLGTQFPAHENAGSGDCS